MFKSQKTLKISLVNVPVVQQVPCKECDLVYVGLFTLYTSGGMSYIMTSVLYLGQMEIQNLHEQTISCCRYFSCDYLPRISEGEVC